MTLFWLYGYAVHFNGGFDSTDFDIDPTPITTVQALQFV